MENIIFKCEFCGKEFGTKNACNSHRGKCKQNPNAKQSRPSEKWLEAMHKRKGKGTNQYTYAREHNLPIPKGANAGKEGYWKGKHLSDEVKRKMSETMKRKIAEGSFIVPYKRNHSNKVSYPEKYFMEVFKELPMKYNYQVGLYQLDFAIPEKKVYVEIDGEQHYVDKRIVEHDKERTKKLNALGWNCLRRIRWSEFQKLSQDEKINYCNELVNELQSL